MLSPELYISRNIKHAYKIFLKHSFAVMAC